MIMCSLRWSAIAEEDACGREAEVLHELVDGSSDSTIGSSDSTTGSSDSSIGSSDSAVGSSESTMD